MLRSIYNMLKKHYQERDRRESLKQQEALRKVMESHFTLDRLLYAKGSEYAPNVQAVNLMKQEANGLRFGNVSIFSGEAVQLRRDIEAFRQALTLFDREIDKELVEVAEGWINTIDGWLSRDTTEPDYLPRPIRNTKWTRQAVEKLDTKIKKVHRVPTPSFPEDDAVETLRSIFKR